jgi:MFS family permease
MIFYGWFIVGAGFLILFASWGAFFSYSVFIIPLSDEFVWSRASTAGVASVNLLLFGAGSIASGRLVGRYGPLAVNLAGGLLVGGGLALSAAIQSLGELYFFNGLIVGLGLSAGWAPLTATIARWFVGGRGLAMGIMSLGISMGMILCPPFCRFLITSWGWRWSFLILGLLSGSVMIVSALFLRKDPPEQNTRSFGKIPVSAAVGVDETAPPGEKDFSLSQAAFTRPFWVSFAGYFLWLTGFVMVSVHLAAFGVDRGLSPISAAFGISLMGLGSIFGKISLGIVSDRIGPQKVLALGLLMQAVAIFGLVASRSAAMIYLFSSIVGFGYGGTGPQMPVLAARLFGLAHLGTIFGVLILAGQIGGAIGPLLAGKIFDLTRSYFLGFSLGGVAVLGAALLIYLLQPPRMDPRVNSQMGR